MEVDYGYRITFVHIFEQWGQNTKFHPCLGPERHEQSCSMYEVALWTYNNQELSLHHFWGHSCTSKFRDFPVSKSFDCPDFQVTNRVTFFSKQGLHRTQRAQNEPIGSGSQKWLPVASMGMGSMDPWGSCHHGALKAHQGSNPGLTWCAIQRWHSPLKIPTCWNNTARNWSSEGWMITFLLESPNRWVSSRVCQNLAPSTVKSCYSPWPLSTKHGPLVIVEFSSSWNLNGCSPSAVSGHMGGSAPPNDKKSSIVFRI